MADQEHILFFCSTVTYRNTCELVTKEMGFFFLHQPTPESQILFACQAPGRFRERCQAWIEKALLSPDS
jgi:hypothetical protein